MRKILALLIAVLGGAMVISLALAQSPGDRPTKTAKKDYSESSVVKRMMAFDKNKDGKLTRDEITDTRLLRLFDRADTNKDGVVTREELIALAAKLDEEFGEDERGRGPGGRGPGGMFRPGQVLPPFLVERLELTADQKKKLDALQKEVDEKLAKILTKEQKAALEEMRNRGPGGRGPGGRGPGGRGPGGPPPDREE